MIFWTTLELLQVLLVYELPILAKQIILKLGSFKNNTEHYLTQFLWLKNLGASSLSGTGSWGCIHKDCWVCGHLKAWLRMEDLLPRWLTHMAVDRGPQFLTLSWLEASVSYQMDFSRGLVVTATQLMSFQSSGSQPVVYNLWILQGELSHVFSFERVRYFPENAENIAIMNVC